MFIVIAAVFGVVISAMPNIAFGEEELKFDQTDVMDDLKDASIGNKAFDISEYPFDENKDIQVMNFVEYCYSYRANQRGNYGLYIYVYNPKGLNLSTSNKGNKVQMAVSYTADGKPDDYAKFNLEFLSVSAGDYSRLFYKFKVIDRKINEKTFADRVNSIERRYDISGIELTTYGSVTATEYAINGTYTFTGFAKGYGPDANTGNTLQSRVEYLETVELDVKHTFYRTLTSSKGAGYQN